MVLFNTSKILYFGLLVKFFRLILPSLVKMEKKQPPFRCIMPTFLVDIAVLFLKYKKAQEKSAFSCAFLLYKGFLGF